MGDFRSLFFCAAAILAGCAGSDKNNEPWIAELTVERVDFGEEDPIFAGPLSMHRTGDFIVMWDTKADSAIRLFDMSGDRPHYVGEFGRKGSGPYDFSNITLLTPIPGRTDAFGVYDPNHNRYTEVVLTKDGGVSYKQSVSLENGWFVNRTADGGFINSNGYCDYYELCEKYDSTGRLTGRYGDRQIPAPYAGYAPVEVTAAYQYELIQSPDGKKLLAMSTGGEAAGFYRFEGDSVVMVSQFFDRGLDEEFVDGRYMGVRGKTPYGFAAAACDDEYVYILNSDRSMNDDVDAFTSADLMEVYDWQGVRQGRYHLDRRVSQITTPYSDGVMYGVSSDGTDPEIVVLRLNPSK